MNFIRHKLGLAAIVAGLSAGLSMASATAQSALETVQKRGQLICRANGQLPGFSMTNERGDWQGIDADLCRAVAAAVLGNAKKVEFVPLTALQRFHALGSGEVDVLARNSSVTLQRDAEDKVQYAAINFYDGQGFAVSNKLKINKLASLSGSTVCFTRGTTHEANMLNWFRARQLRVTPQGFDTADAMYDAFLASRCAALTQDASAIAATLARRGKSADFTALPEVISKEPLGPYVRGGDDAWLAIVRWTHYAMLEAGERGIGKSNVDNDGEIFERHLGARSPMKLQRGLNALWTQGGQMYPPPLRGGRAA